MNTLKSNKKQKERCVCKFINAKGVKCVRLSKYNYEYCSYHYFYVNIKKPSQNSKRGKKLSARPCPHITNKGTLCCLRTSRPYCRYHMAKHTPEEIKEIIKRDNIEIPQYIKLYVNVV